MTDSPIRIKAKSTDRMQLECQECGHTQLIVAPMGLSPDTLCAYLAKYQRAHEHTIP